MASIFKIDNGRDIISCSMYDDFVQFPKGQKLVQIQLDDGTFKYVLIDEIVSLFDSGFRYKDKKKTYQIDYTYTYNIFSSLFIKANYFINMKDNIYVSMALRNIFDARVHATSNSIVLLAPKKNLGITKMLVVGLNVSVSYLDKYEDDVESSFAFSTYANGWCNYEVPSQNRRKMNAMLVKFDPNRNYVISFDDSYLNYSYDGEIKNCLFFGEYIENLPESSSSYAGLFNTNKAFSTNPETFEIDENLSFNSFSHREFQKLKDQYAHYSNNRYVYNYYDLSDCTLL